MTTPAGAPAWVGTSDYSTYGGHVAKVNYQSQGVINARTDVGAEAFQRLCEDMAAVMRGAAFARVTYICNDSSPAAPLIQRINQMTGIRSISYLGSSAPSGFPSAARNANGDVTFTWASAYNDAYGVSGSVNITQARACVVSMSGKIATPSIVSPTSVRVRAFTASTGVLVSDPVVTLTVWTST